MTTTPPQPIASLLFITIITYKGHSERSRGIPLTNRGDMPPDLSTPLEMTALFRRLGRLYQGCLAGYSFPFAAALHKHVGKNIGAALVLLPRLGGDCRGSRHDADIVVGPNFQIRDVERGKNGFTGDFLDV